MTLGPYPDFAWSHTRQRTLDRCPRRYYYRVYGSWQGWDDEAPSEARTAYRLKQLTSLHRAFGTSVHRRAYELVEAARSGREPPPDEVLRERTRSELGRLYRADRASFEDEPRDRPMLQASYYRDGPDEEDLEKLRLKLDRCLPNLRSLDLWRRIRERDDYVVHAEDPDGEFTPPELEVDGVGVFARPDLVVRDLESDELTVVEWKTGEPREEDREQVSAYGLWVRETMDEAPGRALVHYLLDGTARELELGERQLEAATGRIAEGLEEMRAYVEDPSVNRPRPKDAFPMTDDRWACYRCSYLELCEDELRSRGGLPWE